MPDITLGEVTKIAHGHVHMSCRDFGASAEDDEMEFFRAKKPLSWFLDQADYVRVGDMVEFVRNPDHKPSPQFDSVGIGRIRMRNDVPNKFVKILRHVREPGEDSPIEDWFRYNALQKACRPIWFQEEEPETVNWAKEGF